MKFTILLQLLLMTPLLWGQTTATMETWEYRYPVQHTDLNDSLSIAYVDVGEGDVLLFVHGLGSNLQAWYKNLDSLRHHYRCVAVDLPGYGKSSRGDYPFTMSFFADALAEFIPTLGVEKVHLVGHSMGGQIGMHLALRHPERVAQLALIAPAGLETFTEQQQAWFKQVVTAAVIAATPEAQIIRNFELNFYDMPNDSRFMIDDRLEMRASDDYDFYCQMIPKCVVGMLAEPVFAQLADIETSTLIIYGNDDALIPNRFLNPQMSVLDVAAVGRTYLPNTQIAILPTAGHFVQWEQAAIVNELLGQFYKK